MADRSQTSSSFTIIKGTLLDVTYLAFQKWDFASSKQENLDALKEKSLAGAGTENWMRDVAFVLSRRFDPNGQDRVLVELAKAGCERHVWAPILLWHITRDEFLLRDFLINWLYPRHAEGVYRIRMEALLPYVADLPSKGVTSKEEWAESTQRRVAAGLLGMATDFDLLKGSVAREFTHYHLPEHAFLYVLHALAEVEPTPAAVVRSPDWRMFLMAPEDVERELYHQHQFRRLEFEVAGSLIRLRLPCRTAAQYAREKMQ